MRTRVLLVAVALFVATAVFAAAPAATASANGGSVHCVRYGETLYGIGAAYGVSAHAIAYANGIMNPNWIRAGVCLHIPGGWDGGHKGGWDGGHKGGHDGGWNAGYHGGWDGGNHGGGGQTYCVKWGDTLSSIAWRHGTSTWAIAKANGLWNADYIRVGQDLYIP